LIPCRGARLRRERPDRQEDENDPTDQCSSRILMLRNASCPS
jgi:hypothetical protein